ncbi:hypothetical protein D3C87_301070 [compost metagenome]
MKLSDIVSVISQELGAKNLDEVNKLLKDKKTTPVKFRVSGKALGHLGFTGLIKSVGDEGIKVFETNKVRLIRLEDIEGFDKAKPRSERPVRVKKEEPVKKAKASEKKSVEDDDDGYGRPEKFRKKAPGKGGSSFIPKSRK